MEKPFKKKITWSIHNFFMSEDHHSDKFVVGGCKWSLCAYRVTHDNDDYLVMVLVVVGHVSLPFGWRRNARYLLRIVNQSYIKHSIQSEQEEWFDENSPHFCHVYLFSMNENHAKESGFLVNGVLKIVAEVEVLEVIGKLDVTETTSTIMEIIDVNGFQLLPSQVETMSRVFKKHPEMARGFRTWNPNLRTGYMSLLLGLIETLRQPPHELYKADIVQAYAALGSMTSAGFKLDWLEKKLDEMSEKKEKVDAGVTRMLSIFEKLIDSKMKCSKLEAQFAKEKAEVLAANEPISFHDVF
ncbi:unnamed protein product [Cochlearia groenlandica]